MDLYGDFEKRNVNHDSEFHITIRSFGVIAFYTIVYYTRPGTNRQGPPGQKGQQKAADRKGPPQGMFMYGAAGLTASRRRPRRS